MKADVFKRKITSVLNRPPPLPLPLKKKKGKAVLFKSVIMHAINLSSPLKKKAGVGGGGGGDSEITLN